MRRKCGTIPRQLPPLLIPVRPNSSRSCCSSANDHSRISLTRETSPLRNEMSMLLQTGLASSHSIFCDLGQFRGRGDGCVRSTLDLRMISVAKSAFTGRISVFGKRDHGSASKENKGVSSVSDKHKPTHKVNNTFFLFPEFTYAWCEAHENSLLSSSTPLSSVISSYSRSLSLSFKGVMMDAYYAYVARIRSCYVL